MASELISAFVDFFHAQPAFVARAPGRVNLIGEHVDYNDGFVLPMAIDRDVTLVGAPREDGRVRIHSLNFNQTAEFALDDLKHEGPEWAFYAQGVADMLQKFDFALCGFDAVMQGDVPIASGLSSSAATELATIMAFEAAGSVSKGEGIPRPYLSNKNPIGGVTAARVAQRAESEFVGVKCGIMDQFISSLGKKGQALLIDCRSLEYELVPVPQGATVLVVDTTAPRTLAGSAYNERRGQCEIGAFLLSVDSLRDVDVKKFKAEALRLPEDIRDRVAHVVFENVRVQDAVNAMREGDLETLGICMNQSHDSLRDLYEVSSKELDAVVDIARGVEGVYGARMTGAGFGGCAIALVDDAQVGHLTEVIAKEYPIRTGRTPNIYPCVASDGAGWRKI
jgi:galactokinase